MVYDRGCEISEISEIQPHTVTIEQKERNSILLVQQFLAMARTLYICCKGCHRCGCERKEGNRTGTY
jgi:hypothetical protein